MEANILGQKTFVTDDQVRFAKYSGDWNPMHMDAVLARRTQAGAPVVHGVHTALTGLEFAAQNLQGLPSIALLKMAFMKMVYVGDTVEYRLIARTEKNATM